MGDRGNRAIEPRQVLLLKPAMQSPPPKKQKTSQTDNQEFGIEFPREIWEIIRNYQHTAVIDDLLQQHKQEAKETAYLSLYYSVPRG